MLQIENIAGVLQEFLSKYASATEEVVSFQVFIRLNFKIEAYVLVENSVVPKQIAANISDRFNEYAQEMLNDDTFDCKNYRLNIIVVREDERDEIYENIFPEKIENSKIEKGPRLRLGSLIEQNKNSVTKDIQKHNCKIATFYSYKGGMGRTTTMISYAMHLALNKNKRVAVLDCDFEAPGYLNFFNLSKHNRLINGQVNGLVEYLADMSFAKNEDIVDINNYFINVADSNDSSFSRLSNIYIMPAGNLNETADDDTNSHRMQYLEGLSRLNISNKRFAISNFQKLIDAINKYIQPDIILIDSRTGFNDIIGFASVYLSDLVVGFYGYNAQTIPGLLSMLDSYYDNDYKLMIISSILPKEDGEQLFNDEQRVILEYSKRVHGEDKDVPIILPLHRNHKFELIGAHSANVKDYIYFIDTNSFEDYNVIFNELDQILLGTEKSKNDQKGEVKQKFTEDTRAIELRNAILRNLQKTLSNIQSFAEQTQIDEKTFFFRDCMNELFDDNKFIIKGYKGTGKTYLYKALADPTQQNIASLIRKRANDNRRKTGKSDLPDAKLKFIDIISVGDNDNDNTKLFPFAELGISTIQDPAFYFTKFWKIHTWNSILLDPDFATIKEQSVLKDYVLPIRDTKAIARYEELIRGDIQFIIEIEKDLGKINDFLSNNNTKLFILYDQLDTRINPQYWGKAVSPLISFWRENWNSFSNISPKLFIRTDLFRRIEGTNTARLKDNCINIEWSIKEVFGYFFKLIYSNEESAQALEAIMKKVDTHKQVINNINSGIKSEYKQITPLDKPTLAPLVYIFFGDKVNVKGRKLGNSWNYFETELSNADKSISLRPFITTLDNNAIEVALEKYPDTYVHEIMSSEIYASRDVRIKAANTYFEDLAQDDFSKDLLVFRNYLNSDKGRDYRFKSLKQELFDNLIKQICIEGNLQIAKTEEDLKTILYANGVILEVPTRGGLIYRFASMYQYAWALSNAEKTDLNSDAKIEGIFIGRLEEDPYRPKRFYVNYQSVTYLIEQDETYSNEHKYYYDGAIVEFEFFNAESKKTPGKKILKAIKVKVKP